MDPQPLFLLGAGFNIDANAEFGAIDGAAYPLVADLAGICFDLSRLPERKSIEDLFHEAEQRGDSEPMRRFANRLMRADNHLVQRLLPTKNCYSRFFERFPDITVSDVQL
jgi:hypothetical protein